jgi:transcription elongation factor Elf1
MNTYLCPKCGKKSMVKQSIEPGKYMIICQVCGFERGVLPKDKKRGVV